MCPVYVIEIIEHIREVKGDSTDSITKRLFINISVVAAPIIVSSLLEVGPTP